jgi:hypothetical protein
MMWVSWRTQRGQLIAAGLFLAAFAVWLAITGIMYHDAYLNPESCARGYSFGVSLCTNAPSYGNLSKIDELNQMLLYVVPGALGILIGAPAIARELEQRSSRVAWTQGITRTRWTVCKLLLGAIDWWGRLSFPRVGLRIDPKMFGISGIEPAGVAVLAFFVVAFLGAVIRRPGWTVLASIPRRRRRGAGDGTEAAGRPLASGGGERRPCLVALGVVLQPRLRPGREFDAAGGAGLELRDQ